MNKKLQRLSFFNTAASPCVQGIDFQGVINDMKKGVNVANNFLGENGEVMGKIL